jgi:hypothetical protein
VPLGTLDLGALRYDKDLRVLVITAKETVSPLARA